MTVAFSSQPAGLRLTLPVAIGLITLFGLGLRLWQLSSLSLWIDETYSVWFSARDWDYLLDEVPRIDTFPSFYYATLKVWRFAFGDGEFALRLLSVLVNTLCIPIVAATAWLCGRKGTRETAAVLAALLFACSMTQLSTAQDVRPYAFLNLGLAVALLAAVRILTAPERAARPLRRIAREDGEMALALLGLAFGLALLGWSHNLGLLFCLCLGGALLVWWAAVERTRRMLVNLLMVAALATLFYAPNISTLLMQIEIVDQTGFWLQRPGLFTLIHTLFQLPLGQNQLSLAGRVLGLVADLASLAGLWALVRSGAGGRSAGTVAAVLLFMALGPAVICAALSRIGQPIFLFRTLQPSQIPIIIGMAFAPFFLPAWRPAWRPVVTLGLVLLAAGAVWTREQNRMRPADDWRQAVADLRPTGSAAPAPIPPIVIAPAEAELPVRYYVEAMGLPVEIITVPSPYPAVSEDYLYPAGGGGSPAITAEMMPALVARLEQEERIWFLVRAMNIYDPAGLAEATVLGEFPCVLHEAAQPLRRLLARRTAEGTCPAQ